MIAPGGFGHQRTYPRETGHIQAIHAPDSPFHRGGLHRHPESEPPGIWVLEEEPKTGLYDEKHARVSTNVSAR